MPYLLAVFALETVCSCSDNEQPENDSSLPDAEPITLTVLPEKITSDNRFALDLFLSANRFAKANENVFVSPLSVSMALNMTLNGAQGETADEIKTALREDGYSIDDINEYNLSLRTALLNVDPSTELGIANSIWYRTGFQVKSPFIDVNKKSYDAEVKNIDFSKPEALTQINGWCAEKTNDKIPEIIKEIPDEAMMYLINAVYFKGIWRSQFDTSDTKKEDFYLSDGKTAKADMMRQTGSFNYTADDAAGYLELPYGNQAFSMIIALPHEGQTLDDITDKLDGEYWNSLIGNLYGHEINIRLPRFKTECEYKMENDILPYLGMNIPFLDNADFSGISATPLKISSVIHKTFVEVNEEGTEAAAVTAVEMALTAFPTPTSPIDFFVNKPFIFAIRERSTGVILFIGKIEKV